MFKRHILAAAFAAVGVLGLSNSANAFIITFDAQGLTGPSFASSTSEMTVPVTTPIGTVTFSGGAILTAESFLPADQTSVYYTSFFLPGPGIDPITITFPTNITNFFLNVYNGETHADSFTVSDNLGNTNTVSLAPNSAGGMSLISFPAAGNVVTIFTNDTSGFDFSIDNIGFDQPTPTVPEPATWVMMIVGFGLVGFQLRRRSAIAA